ncbi:hypothetical protein PIB30_075819 [Stylosanthes scabra]|uniref:Uncharacterized protein n=1 Tax=Stylosanthes scabra TaxID=79078 RepID=A0ABU6SS05_9FABA|nr:hypothetical protein [Stylosanthes scabra]
MAETLCLILRNQEENQRELFEFTKNTGLVTNFMTRMATPSLAYIPDPSKASSSGGISSQPFPSLEGGINAITARSGTTLQEDAHIAMGEDEAMKERMERIGADAKEGWQGSQVYVKVSWLCNTLCMQQKAALASLGQSENLHMSLGSCVRGLRSSNCIQRLKSNSDV